MELHLELQLHLSCSWSRSDRSGVNDLCIAILAAEAQLEAFFFNFKFGKFRAFHQFDDLFNSF